MILSALVGLLNSFPSSWAEAFSRLRYDLAVLYAIGSIVVIVVIVFIVNLILAPHRIYKEQQKEIEGLKDNVKALEDKMKREREEKLKGYIARCARALRQINWAIRQEQWEEEEEAANRGESWFGDPSIIKEEETTEAMGLARNIITALGQSIELPKGIDRKELISACSSIRHEGFDSVTVHKILDSAALILTSKK